LALFWLPFFFHKQSPSICHAAETDSSTPLGNPQNFTVARWVGWKGALGPDGGKDLD
jgi:hypothetical protein